MKALSQKRPSLFFGSSRMLSKAQGSAAADSGLCFLSGRKYLKVIVQYLMSSEIGTMGAKSRKPWAIFYPLGGLSPSPF